MVTGLGVYSTGDGSTESEKHYDILLISYDIRTSRDSVAFLSKLFQRLCHSLSDRVRLAVRHQNMLTLTGNGIWVWPAGR